VQIINQMLRNTKRCNKKKDNPEKLETQDEEKKNKNTTQYAFDTTICKQDIRPPTNNWRQRRTEHRSYALML
jgi:hypothetical protein